MPAHKTAKDLMVDVFDYPHIPYWFTIKQAAGIVKKSLLSGEKCHHPMAVLAFDEKYNLLGTLTLNDILKGLEPKCLNPLAKSADEPGQWDTLFGKESRESLTRPVSDIMTPAKFFVAPDDPVTKAAYLMLHHDLILLPVLENKKKFVGVIRMIEVFGELSDAVLK